MKNVLLSRNGTNSIALQIQDVVYKTQPKCLCVATAYLTQAGARYLVDLATDCNIQDVRIVAGLSGEVTHPNAIRFLHEQSWDVRFGQQSKGIFHPKLLVGGDKFSNVSGLRNPAACYLGSANFTASGLKINTELGCTSTDTAITNGVAQAFKELWNSATRFTQKLLTQYESKFSQRIQTRSTADLINLGIVDDFDSLKSNKKTRSNPVLNAQNASTVWVGLESFTGDYNFQVEIPAKAATVLKNLLGTRGRNVNIECADGIVRKMIYSYYPHNGMARLNVPNEVPLVAWARENKKGALVISRLDENDHLYAEILKGRKLQEIQQRSFALGTWGETSTRYYGWY